ncbi:hypothetical protein AHAS_Ahas19G0375400 [Arachis hypogaea]
MWCKFYFDSLLHCKGHYCLPAKRNPILFNCPRTFNEDTLSHMLCLSRRRHLQRRRGLDPLRPRCSTRRKGQRQRRPQGPLVSVLGSPL